MQNKGLQTAAPQEQRRSRFDELFAPLDRLLVSGGDTRLAVDPASGLNGYGCSPHPRREAFAFSSSTATSISERGYRQVLCARERLIEASASKGLIAAFDAETELARASLKALLGLDETGIVFAPSGTDAQLHALYIAKLALGLPVTTIVVASDQTGSGTAFTARGQHFAGHTAQGLSVEKGAPIAGLADAVSRIDIPLVTLDGSMRSDTEIDGLVRNAVAIEIAKGRRVVLQTMDASKFGYRAPTDACVEDVCAQWPGAVQVVVDACQMRTSRARLQAYLGRGHIVLISGSKFFTGPAFSGATLVPSALVARIAAIEILPNGLADYASCFDIPPCWPRLRAQLAAEPNVGQWLRWVAALEEMRAWFALPDAFRNSALARLAGGIETIVASAPHLELLPARTANRTSGIDEGEMGLRTIFSFLLRRGERTLTFDEVANIYRNLNSDLSQRASEQHRLVASRLCHVGQPVRLNRASSETAALRIAIGARTLSDCWSADENAARQNIRDELDRVAAAVAKIDWLIGALP